MKAYGEIYKAEIESFKKLGEKFLAGELSVPEFKGKSGGFGVYAQRGKEGFMIRLRTLCGYISYEHMKLVRKYVEKYEIESIHLTSREAIQLHDLSLDQVCDIMEDAIDHDLFTRGGGGNYPRNVALSPMSGVEKKEAFDVTDFAMQVSEYFVSHASEYHLPRKLKVAFSNSAKDTSYATINDLGFVAVVKDNKPYFRVFLAGGMGKDPAVAIPYEQLIEPWEAMYYVESYTRMFIELGDYQNRAKARSRYIPRRVGTEAFLESFQKHLERVEKTESYDKIEAVITEETMWESEIPDSLNLRAQKQKDLYSVVIHPRFGKISAKKYSALCDFVENALMNGDPEHKIELRISMEEELYIRNLTYDQAREILGVFEDDNGTTNLTQSISCVGVPTCQIGIQNSRELLLSILDTIKEHDIDQNLLPKIHVSGCPNSCTRHQVASLGFAGKKASAHGKIFDVFEVYAGGRVHLDETHMGKCYGTIPIEHIPGFVLELSELLDREELCFEKLLDTREEEFCELLSKYLLTQA